MKKSFMTRVLATGLSLAMAFSLTAATNVSVASAASTPAMASKQFAVRVGGAAKSYKASAATQKSYKISKATVGNTDKATVKVNSSKKSIKVTPGTVTGTTVVKISFKNIKTKKTTSKKYRCVVKAAVVEKQAIEKVEVTGVKTVTLTMAKDVASVESPVAITVKKGTADRPCKATAEGKTIKLAMEAKLTQGSYNVNIAGLETEALTAEFAVEKDETLTSFQVSDYIVAKSFSETTTGSIKFAALNQYGEKMVANDPTVTCSFGTVAGQKPFKSATATAEGVIQVTDINSVLAIPGQKGTVVLVGEMGVTTTKEITYNTFAKASKVEVIGLYHINSAKLESLKENDKIDEYELLMRFTDQYDSVMTADELGNTVRVTISGGLTDISVNATSTSFTTRTYDGEDYVAVKLVPATGKTKAVAGDATLLITNDFYGMLLNDKITVSKNVVIKNMTITADNGIYQNQDNEMNYEFVDTDGNSVTDYATLVGCDLDLGTYMRLERQKDGKAKVIFNGKLLPVISQQKTDKASTPVTTTCYANKQTGGDYLVKTFTFTASEARYAKGVTGIKPDVTTSISAADTGKNLTIKSTDIYLADQYSNKVTSDEKIFDKQLSDASQGSITGTSTGTSVAVVTSSAFNDVYIDTVNNKIIATPSGIAGSATVYLKYKWYNPVLSDESTKPVKASSTNYDAKFTLTAYETKNVDVSTLEITEIKGGWDLTTTTAAGLTPADVTVKALVGGVKTVIPASQYIILKNENKDFNNEDDLKGVKSKTAKLTVQVTTWDSANTPIETLITKEYTVSRADSKLFKVTDVVGDVTNLTPGVSTNAILTKTNFVNQFKFRDQYGSTETAGTGTPATIGTLDTNCVTYTIDMMESTNIKGYTISHNGTNDAKIQFTKSGVYKFKVTATSANGATKSVIYEIKVN